MITYTDNTQGAKKFVRDCLDFGEMDPEEASRLLTEGVFVSAAPNVWEVQINGKSAAMLVLDHQSFEFADWLLEEI